MFTHSLDKGLIQLTFPILHFFFYKAVKLVQNESNLALLQNYPDTNWNFTYFLKSGQPKGTLWNFKDLFLVVVGFTEMRQYSDNRKLWGDSQIGINTQNEPESNSRLPLLGHRSDFGKIFEAL